jgi:hypothetical protein
VYLLLAGFVCVSRIFQLCPRSCYDICVDLFLKLDLHPSRLQRVRHYATTLGLQNAHRRATVHPCLQQPQHPTSYLSTLPFLPANSALSETFSERFLDTLRAASGHDVNWLQAAQSVLKERSLDY